MEKYGEQFLHQRDQRLHTSHAVEHEKARKERKGEKTSQKPAEKIADWLEVIEQTHMGHRDDPRVFERIKDYYHKQYVIKPEEILESYFENQRRIAREQGHGDIEITDAMRGQSAETIINDQISTLDNWVEYFSSPDSETIPMWAKYWAFTSMLKLSLYDKEKHSFAKRDKDTVAPFPDLNREALAYVIDAVVKKVNKEEVSAAADNPELQQLLQGSNFGKLYAYAIEKVTPAKESELMNTQGEWIKYPHNSDHMPLVESLQGHGTGWCTAGESTAEAQLKMGDFYVYYSRDRSGKPTVPRVAIRMQGGNIAEVRGIAPEQNLDPYIGDVLKEKLKEFPDGKEYEKKSQDMKTLTGIEAKANNHQELTKEEITFLYEVESPIQGFGHRKDPRIEEIIESRDKRADLTFALGIPGDKISFDQREALKGGVVFHYGSLDLRSWVSGEGLKLPKTIGGDLDLDRLTSADGLELPQTIRGSLYIGSLVSAKDLKFPQTIGGNLRLISLRSVEDLELPQTIGGDIDLRYLISAKGLKFPQTIEGSIRLWNLASAEETDFPQTIGGSLEVQRLTSAKGLKLPKTIGGDLDLRSFTSIAGLELPQTVGRDLNLGSLTSAEGLRLPKTVGYDLDLGNLTSAEGLEFPRIIEGTLYLNCLASAKGLKLPRTIGVSLSLNSLTSAEDLKLPENHRR